VKINKEMSLTFTHYKWHADIIRPS